MSACRALLSDRRWHFQHGPIDLVIAADGDDAAVAAAHRAAWRRFLPLLDELVAELPLLRNGIEGPCLLRGVVARRMRSACAAHATRYVTPMAAVAGAVADEIVACYRRPGIVRAAVNNGGDIALHLAAGASWRIGLHPGLHAGLHVDSARLPQPRAIGVDGRFTVTRASPVRGIATSGWRGRSLSLGIADAVTVLARTAADADAAATMIANTVDVDDPRIGRSPASMVRDGSDLGDRLVTVDVPPLEHELVLQALERGLRHAEALRGPGTIIACSLTCQGMMRTTHATSDGRAWHGSRFLEAA